jgi:hypothetical protein
MVAILAVNAISAINAQDSTVNVAGGNITTIYNVDPNCNQGIGQSTIRPRLNSPFAQTKSSSGYLLSSHL